MGRSFKGKAFCKGAPPPTLMEISIFLKPFPKDIHSIYSKMICPFLGRMPPVTLSLVQLEVLIKLKSKLKLEYLFTWEGGRKSKINAKPAFTKIRAKV